MNKDAKIKQLELEIEELRKDNRIKELEAELERLKGWYHTIIYPTQPNWTGQPPRYPHITLC